MRTDFQKFTDLLNETGVEYEIIIHARGVKEIQIHPKFIYQVLQFKQKKTSNTVSIDFNADDKFMCFHGETL